MRLPYTPLLAPRLHQPTLAVLTGDGDGVLFWIGVQHPLGEAGAGVHGRPPVAAGEMDVNLHAQLRSCQQALQALQLQELCTHPTLVANGL